MKNQKAIILLFIANTISGFSQGISLIAIPWYFVDVLDEPALSAYIYFFATLLSLFWGPYAGTLVDKYSRKTIFLLTNVVGAVLFLSASIFSFQLGEAPIFILAALFTATFLIFNIHYPSLYAFAQELVEPKDYGKITSYIEVQGQTTSVISGAMAAILLKGGNYDLGLFNLNIAKWEMSNVILLDGCTYFASVFVILLISYKPTVERNIENNDLVSRFKVGFNFLRERPYILLFGVLSFTVFATILVTNFVSAPNYVKNVLKADANVYALHEVFYAFGAIAAGLFVTKFFKRYSAITGVMCLHFVCGLVYLIFSFLFEIPVFLALMFLVGLANAGSRVLRITFLLERIPNSVIGRTGSIFMIINVLERMSLIALFSIPFFVKNVQFSYLICAFLCWIALFMLYKNYKPIANLPLNE